MRDYCAVTSRKTAVLQRDGAWGADMIQPDLFTYPLTAGWRSNGGPSRDAAKGIEAAKAPTLRQKVLALFMAGHELTADECAARLGESILSTRPRCAELHKQGKLTDTGLRRRSDGGRMASVWRRAT